MPTVLRSRPRPNAAKVHGQPAAAMRSRGSGLTGAACRRAFQRSTAPCIASQLSTEVCSSAAPGCVGARVGPVESKCQAPIAGHFDGIRALAQALPRMPAEARQVHILGAHAAIEPVEQSADARDAIRRQLARVALTELKRAALVAETADHGVPAIAL